MIAIARNLVIDHLRASKLTEPFEEGHDGDGRLLDGSSIEEEANLGLSPGLAAALSRLSDRDREVIALRFGGDLKGAEIAEELDLTLGNVQQILSRVLRKLNAELEAVEGHQNDRGAVSGRNRAE